MREAALTPIAILTTSLTLVLITSLLAIKSKDMLKAVIYSAAESAAVAIVYLVLMAPDIALTQIAVGVGIMTVFFLIALRRTYRWEDEY